MRRSFKKGQKADTWRRRWRNIELTKKTVAVLRSGIKHLLVGATRPS